MPAAQQLPPQTQVFSGVLMDGANLEGSTLVGVEMSRAIARDAKLAGIDLTDANAFATVFDGSDLRGAQFENAILSSASFGKGAGGNWANLEDAHFEGALLSSSDISRVCANPTISPVSCSWCCSRLPASFPAAVIPSTACCLKPALPTSLKAKSSFLLASSPI